MKLSLLKSIITDLHMAGIHDSSADSFMNLQDMGQHKVLDTLLGLGESVNNNKTTENFDEDAISQQMNDLFANFGSGSAAGVENLTTINPVQKNVTKKITTKMPDPRNSKTPKPSSEALVIQQTKQVLLSIHFLGDKYSQGDLLVEKLDE